MPFTLVVVDEYPFLSLGIPGIVRVRRQRRNQKSIEEPESNDHLGSSLSCT